MARQRMLTLCFLGGSILVLLLLASGLSGLTFRPGHFYALPSGPASAPAGGVAPSGTARDWLTAIFSLLGILSLLYLIGSLILAIFSAKYRRYLLQQITAIGIILLLFFLIIRLLGGGGAPRSLEPAPAPSQVQPPAGGEAFPTFSAAPTAWFTWAISALLAVLLIGGIWFFWRRGRPQPEPSQPPLAAAAQQALSDIRAGGDLYDAVLRCYHEMSRLLAERQGVQRERTMTPREFALHLREAGLRDEHIQRLTRLFEHVRYGGRHASEREAQEAVACLTAIVTTYGERA